MAYQTKWETRKAKVIAKLEGLAKKEMKITKKLKVTRCEIRRCKLIFARKYNYKQAHKLQLVLYKITRKLAKIHAEYVKRSEAKSFRIIRKRFVKQQRLYVVLEKTLKHVRHQLVRLERKIAAAEQRLPYLADKEKIVGKAVIVSLEKIKRKVEKKIHVLERQRIIVMKKYLALNKEYLIQLHKRIDGSVKRKAELIAKRPALLKAALYELIPQKQQRAERKLNAMDKETEHLDARVVKDKHEIKESIRIRKFLEEAIKPKVTCKGKGVINCNYCHSLGRILKVALRNREEDHIILERLQHKCSKELPENQARCMDVAMKLSAYGVKFFDPMKFKVAKACQKIGVCGN